MVSPEDAAHLRKLLDHIMQPRPIGIGLTLKNLAVLAVNENERDNRLFLKDAEEIFSDAKKNNRPLSLNDALLILRAICSDKNFPEWPYTGGGVDAYHLIQEVYDLVRKLSSELIQPIYKSQKQHPAIALWPDEIPQLAEAIIDSIKKQKRPYSLEKIRESIIDVLREEGPEMALRYVEYARPLVRDNPEWKHTYLASYHICPEGQVALMDDIGAAVLQPWILQRPGKLKDALEKRMTRNSEILRLGDGVPRKRRRRVKA